MSPPNRRGGWKLPRRSWRPCAGRRGSVETCFALSGPAPSWGEDPAALAKGGRCVGLLDHQHLGSHGDSSSWGPPRLPGASGRVAAWWF